MTRTGDQPVDETEQPDETVGDGDDFDPRYIVPGLSRGLAMLGLFTSDNPRQTLQELSNGLNITRSAAYRLAYTLEKDGFIARDEATRRYSLTVRATSFAFQYLASQDLVGLAAVHLRRLSETINASAYLVQRDGYHAVYVLRMIPPVRLVSNLQVGTRSPLHVTASGRMLLALQPADERARLIRALHKHCDDRHLLPPAELETRAREDLARGYVYRPSLVDPGVTSCAAPICDMFGTSIAAITVIGPEPVLNAAGGEPQVAKLVTEAAHLLRGELGYRN